MPSRRPILSRAASRVPELNPNSSGAADAHCHDSAFGAVAPGGESTAGLGVSTLPEGAAAQTALNPTVMASSVMTETSITAGGVPLPGDLSLRKYRIVFPL